MATFSVSVAASGDDGYVDQQPTHSTGGTTLYVGARGAPYGQYHTWMRFDNVTIPAGSTINTATVTVYGCSENGSGQLTKLYCVDADDPAASANKAAFDGFALTTAAVDYDPAGSFSGTMVLPDISTCIQEVIDRGGWASGNAIIVIWRDDGTSTGAINRLLSASWDHASENPPLLEIDYTEGSLTLAADAGSYTITGRAATLLASRKLTADAGSYTVTGQSAGLLAGRKLTTDAGSYTVSGQAATLLVSRLLATDAGSYATTGQDATLLVSRLLAAEAGEYSLTGLDATLTYTPNGGPTYTLTADAGSYALSGQTASLIVSRLLSADAGVYSLSGQDAQLLFGRLLQGDAGSYSVTGQAATLLASRLLSANAGSYSVTGQAVTLVYSGEVVPVTPAGRVYVVPAENRVFVIVAESRTSAIEVEDRTFVVY